MGTHGMVSSTHYLASEAGHSIQKKGGNVVDAGAGMWFCLTLLQPHLAGVAGEAPILVYLVEEERVIAVNGQGPAPRSATIDWFKDNGYRLIPPDGFLPAVVPGAFDAWLTLMEDYGTMRVSEILRPAVRLAGEGFPVYPSLVRFITDHEERFRSEWPSSAEVYLPKGNVPRLGSLIRNGPWAHTFKNVAKFAEKARSQGRSSEIDAVRDYFYRGPIAENHG
jgi:gamma-glutamyltranspeptidase/glutathione hydrolase